MENYFEPVRESNSSPQVTETAPAWIDYARGQLPEGVLPANSASTEQARSPYSSPFIPKATAIAESGITPYPQEAPKGPYTSPFIPNGTAITPESPYTSPYLPQQPGAITVPEQPTPYTSPFLPKPDGFAPTPIATPVDHPTLPPAPVPLHPEERALVEGYFRPRSNLDGFVSRNSIIGASLGFGAWGLDKALERQMLQDKVTLGWWKPLSPMLRRESDLTNVVAMQKTQVTDLLEKIKVIEPDLAKSTSSVAKLANTIQSRLNDPILSEAERRILGRQDAFLRSGTSADLLTVKRALGTLEELNGGRATFVRGSLEGNLLTEHATQFGKMSELTRSHVAAQGRLANLERLLEGHYKNAAGSWFQSTLKGAGIGALTAGGTLLAGYAIDRLIGHEGKMDTAHLISDGLVAPAFLLSPMSARYKLPLAAASMLAGRIGDFANKDAQAIELHPVLRPNIVDGIGMTAAAMTPCSLPFKVGMFAAAAAAGRVYNGLASAFDLDGTSISNLRGDAQRAFDYDQKVKTVESYNKALAREKAMGLKTDDAILLNWEDWSKNENTMDMHSYMRGTALIFDSLGRTRLEMGSRLDPDNHDVNRNRILKNEKMDFGGEATQDLRRAAGVLMSAQDYAISHPGSVPSSSYVEELRELQRGVESQLDSIYGAHDIESAFTQLQNTNQQELQKAVYRMRQNLEVRLNSSKDQRFLAKSARDICLGELVLASRKHAEQILYSDALRYLALSESLDPSCSDNQALRKIVSNFPNKFVD